jgi:hypothetical protein
MSGYLGTDPLPSSSSSETVSEEACGSGGASSTTSGFNQAVASTMVLESEIVSDKARMNPVFR